jgi:hypothetical protein
MNNTYTEKAHSIKQFSATKEQIETYSEQVRKGQIKCNQLICRRCSTSSSAFSRHEARERQFYIISEDIVKIILGLLIRWKCSGCGKTLTDYPDFALPYKRYTVPTIERYSSLYTEDDQASYRKVIIKNSIGYPDSEKQLNHTTVHRWITSLGSYGSFIRTAQDLYLQAKPESNICRELAGLSIPPKKYFTKDRKGILQRCRQLLRIEIKFDSFLKVSIFPRLATQSGFT